MKNFFLSLMSFFSTIIKTRYLFFHCVYKYSTQSREKYREYSFQIDPFWCAFGIRTTHGSLNFNSMRNNYWIHWIKSTLKYSSKSLKFYSKFYLKKKTRKARFVSLLSCKKILNKTIDFCWQP
ncbi:putative G-protein coupled receptor 125 [Sarcoptes scabiei]|nr:putative G-protein coupled receptor 125 [Sarcoptes scabiei]